MGTEQIESEPTESQQRKPEQIEQAYHRLIDSQTRRADLLDLSGLGLRSLPAYFPIHTTILRLNDNYLDAMPENLPPSLTHLYIESNLLSSLGFNFPASTTALFAADNRISVFPELPLHNLRILSLDRNRIGAWPQYFAPYLRELYVSGNLLSEFPPDLPSELAILSIERNRIDTLPEKLPANLRRLLADHNLLRSVTSNLLELPAPAFVNLADNQLPSTIVNQIKSFSQAPHYDGPRIHLD
ncbi:hypothetical protein QN368_19405 [Undibacterium sp. CCC3.4]|nr:hypothetical protein [Undibacterium sp. CCC3.4]